MPELPMLGDTLMITVAGMHVNAWLVIVFLCGAIVGRKWG